MRCAFVALAAILLPPAVAPAQPDAPAPPAAPAEPIVVPDRARVLESLNRELELARAAQAKPNDPQEVERLRKQVELLQKQIEVLQKMATQLAEQAVKAAPGQVDALVQQSRVRLDHAVSLDPMYADARFFRAIVLATEYGDFATAQSDLQRYIVLAPAGSFVNQARDLLAQVTNAIEGTPIPTTTLPAGKNGTNNQSK